MNNYIPNPHPTDFKVGDRISLTIDRLSYDGGRGVGRLNNFVFFVPDSAPNEKIEAEITLLKKNFGEAKLLKIIDASPQRRKPLCPVVDECGGCAWQHIAYSEQLEQKLGFIKYHLKSVLPENIIVPPVVASENEFHYRNRVQVHVQNNQRKEIQYGFFKKGTNSIIPIDDCAIAEPALFKDLKSAFASNKFKIAGAPHKFELALNPSGQRILRDLDEVESVFTQVNSLQNTNLCNYVVQQVHKHRPSRISEILDLYCGSGNITIPLAKNFPGTQIVGVEYSRAAIERAQENKPEKVKYIAQDVYEFLKKQPTQANSVISLDPARAGLSSKISQELLRLKPALIVYVSCSLPSLARDLQHLCKDHYKIAAIRGFDMFPQTEYVETVVTLLPRDMKAFCSQ